MGTLPDTGGLFRSVRSCDHDKLNGSNRFTPKMKRPKRPPTQLEVVDLEIEGEDESSKTNSGDHLPSITNNVRPQSTLPTQGSSRSHTPFSGRLRPKSTRLPSTKALHGQQSGRPQSRLALASSKRTITRVNRKPRESKAFVTENTLLGDHTVDSDSESEQLAHIRVGHRISTTDDYGGIDISADNGWDTDLEAEEEKEAFDHTGKSVYIETCKRNGVIPASYFLRHMHDQQLEMRHHGLGPNGVRPLCVSLVSNARILKLDLTDNWLGFDGGSKVCEMLKENCFISDLNLSHNRLETAFAEAFTSVLSSNTTLTHINLAGNELDDFSALYIADAMMNTTKVELLNLSNNKFGEKSGLLFGPAIAENSSIKHLDLSWNSIRRKGAVEIARGIKQNVLMSKINLSWNGFGNDGAKALGDALKANSCLEELDISNNRISTEGSVLLGKGLAVNETLKVLKMGKNPMQSSGCYAICAAILRNPGCALENLDFSDILVNNDFFDKFKQVKEQLPNIKLKHGGDGVPKKPKARVHPMVKLTNYIAKQNMKLVDFFNKFDKDHQMSVTREEFTQGIEEIGIRLTEDEITFLLDDLDKDGDGEINYSELVVGHQDFTEKERKMANTIASYKDGKK